MHAWHLTSSRLFPNFSVHDKHSQSFDAVYTRRKYSVRSCTLCVRGLVCCVISHATYCFRRLARFFVGWTALSTSFELWHFVFSLPYETEELRTKCAAGHTLRVLKSTSFVLKCKYVVSMLSPSAFESYEGPKWFVQTKEIFVCLSSCIRFTVFFSLIYALMTLSIFSFISSK